jgi:hypothetical protein
MLSVLASALSDLAVGRIVFATESCIPLFDLEEVGTRLFEEDKSWLNAFHTPKSSWENGACFRSVDSHMIPPEVSLF